MVSQVVIAADGVLARGSAGDSGLHAHRALQLVWAPAAPFLLDIEDQSAQAHWAVIEPMHRHRIRGDGQPLAHLFLDPGQRHFRHWQRTRAAVSPDPDLQQRLRSWTTGSLDAVACMALIRLWRAHSLPGLADGLPADPRIRDAAQWIADDPTDAHCHHRALAARVHLSPSRFQALFRAHTGQSVQQYVLWQRLLMGLRQLGAGDGVTAAALNCGFSDSAHFSRSFRRILGAAPSEIRLLQATSETATANWSG